MFGMSTSVDGILSVEVFAAKDLAGVYSGVMMTVPLRCGLQDGDLLRINGTTAVAVRRFTVLPLSFPSLEGDGLAALVALGNSGQSLAVGEFSALGLVTSYFLALEIASD